ncbi:MAG: hypothetical protein Tsb0013_07660 [Phycisphaerales bacterium]
MPTSLSVEPLDSGGGVRFACDPATFRLILFLLADIDSGAVRIDWPAMLCGRPDDVPGLIDVLKT